MKTKTLTLSYGQIVTALADYIETRGLMFLNEEILDIDIPLELNDLGDVELDIYYQSELELPF